MKKALACLMVSVFIIGMTSCKKINKNTENMYFASPYNTVLVDGKWTDIPIEVCRYTGGDTYSVAYTFPDTEIYTFTIFSDTLYYMLSYKGDSITRVDLNSGETDVYAEFEYEGARWLLADENGVYLSCCLSYDDNYGCLYKFTETETKLISESMINFPRFQHIAIGEHGLFFAEQSDTEVDGRILKCYDTESEEINVIAETDASVQISRLDYTEKYVYTANNNCYRINTETGESEFIAQGAGYRVHDGWLYYVDNRFCEDHIEYEVMRRRIDSNTVETCGKTYIPYLGAISFADSIEFGKKGFIIYCTERKERTEYMYFKYGEYGGAWLTPQTP